MEVGAEVVHDRGRAGVDAAAAGFQAAYDARLSLGGNSCRGITP
jgi:hypothetical protein